LDRPFSLANAWWLSELSRLVYRRDPEVSERAPGPTRGQVLAKVGLEEVEFLDIGGTQASVIRPLAAARPYSVLAFRGTEGLRDWFANLQMGHSSWDGDAKVHRGFKRALEAVWTPIEDLLASPGPWFYTGHSLGGALATLAASRRPSFATYTFGAPRVGSAEFAADLEGADVFRWVNHRDPVTRLPPAALGGRYLHAGRACLISSPGGPALEGVEEAGGLLLRRQEEQHPPRAFDPPGRLTDHTPVNYVAQLERLFGEQGAA
jgi:pimeloyl-ACP methyl ester carboxylesterase